MNLLKVVVALTVFATLAACGDQPVSSGSGPASDAPASDVPVSGGAAGMCVEGATECVDTIVGTEPVPIDETGIAQFRRDAKFYLGKPRAELNDLIRIGRIGDEQRMLTQDYQIGRITVELDKVDGQFIVTKSTVELPDGPQTFELQP